MAKLKLKPVEERDQYAAAVLDAFDSIGATFFDSTKEKCKPHIFRCVNDGKHGRDEEWACKECGYRYSI